MTTKPAYTQRPRKRTEGGVFRRRQPSLPQHKLKRTCHRGPPATPGLAFIIAPVELALTMAAVLLTRLLD